jgi:hypothetical protein
MSPLLAWRAVWPNEFKLSYTAERVWQAQKGIERSKRKETRRAVLAAAPG